VVQVNIGSAIARGTTPEPPKNPPAGRPAATAPRFTATSVVDLAAQLTG
jgi:hypothetical protein